MSGNAVFKVLSQVVNPDFQRLSHLVLSFHSLSNNTRERRRSEQKEKETTQTVKCKVPLNSNEKSAVAELPIGRNLLKKYFSAVDVSPSRLRTLNPLKAMNF